MGCSFTGYPRSLSMERLGNGFFYEILFLLSLTLSLSLPSLLPTPISLFLFSSAIYLKATTKRLKFETEYR